MTHIPPAEIAQDDQLMAKASHQLKQSLTHWQAIQANTCCPIHANRAAHRHIHEIIAQGDNSICLMLVTAIQQLAQHN